MGYHHWAVSQDARRRSQPARVRILLARPLGDCSAHPCLLNSSFVKFSPNGKFVLASTLDSTIRLWDYHAEKAVKVYSGHTNLKCIIPFLLFTLFVVSGI
jgi:WD40 repeat protein